MKRLEIDHDVQAGVEAAFYADPPATGIFEQRLTPEAAQTAHVTMEAHLMGRPIADIERKADFVGSLALRDAKGALEILGGVEGALETMGETATQKLLQLVEDQDADR